MNKCKDCGHEQATWKGRLCEECQAHEYVGRVDLWDRPFNCYVCAQPNVGHKRKQFTYVASNVIVS